MYRDVRSFTMGNGIKKLFLQPDQNWRINKVYEMKVWLLPEAVKWRLEEIEVKTWDELPGCYWCGLGRGEEGCEWPEVKRGMPFVFEWENENGAQVGGV